MVAWGWPYAAALRWAGDTWGGRGGGNGEGRMGLVRLLWC